MSEKVKRLDVLGPPLKFKSFLSQFYLSGNSRIVKFYKPQDFYDGALPLSDPDFRASLVADEVVALNLLSPNLGAELVLHNDGAGDETGIDMNLVPSENLLPNQIDLEGPNRLPLDFFRRLAELVHSYHFNPQLCPSVADVDLTNHHLNKVLLEIEFNRQLVPQAGMSLPERFTTWEDLIKAFVSENKGLFETRQRLLGEPHYCLGDIRIENCGIDNGDPFFLDPLAPVQNWRVLDRFIDAILIRADLVTLGKLEEAEAYWNEYLRLYNESIELNLLPKDERQEIENSHRVMERLAYLQRLGLIVSVSASNLDLDTLGKSLRLLSATYDELESHLKSG